MGIAIVSLSSRRVDGLDLLKTMVERISFSNQILKISDIFQTQDKANVVETAFLSCCLEVDTDMTPSQFLQFLMESQEQINSEHQAPKQIKSKIIDCDLIDYRGEMARTPQLTLPHPEAHLRAYVIIPLAEMEPDWEHPVLKKKATTLAQEAFWPGWGSFFKEGKTLLDF